MNAICTVLLGLIALATAYPYYGHYPYYHYGYYGYPASYYGGYIGYAPAHNHEFDYRQFGGYPVHVGGGQFYFLGTYGGSCAADHSYGFYYAAADSTNSFIVCDHGRAHQFQCPAGTKNRDHGYFIDNHVYNFHELCGEHTNQA